MITIQQIENILTNESVKLIKEYKIQNCELLICTVSEYIQHNYTYVYKKYCKTVKQTTDSILQDLSNYFGSFARSEYNLHNDKMHYFIIVPKENLYKLLYDVAFESPVKITDDEIIEYLQMVIRHEIGHIIQNIKIFESMGIENGHEYIQSNDYEDMQNYMDQVSSYYEDEEYDNVSEFELQKLCIDQYYEIRSEQNANNAVNIDVERFKILELKVRLGLVE